MCYCNLNEDQKRKVISDFPIPNWKIDSFSRALFEFFFPKYKNSAEYTAIVLTSVDSYVVNVKQWASDNKVTDWGLIENILTQQINSSVTLWDDAIDKTWAPYGVLVALFVALLVCGAALIAVKHDASAIGWGFIVSSVILLGLVFIPYARGKRSNYIDLSIRIEIMKNSRAKLATAFQIIKPNKAITPNVPQQTSGSSVQSSPLINAQHG
jgi:hypothetical protein